MSNSKWLLEADKTTDETRPLIRNMAAAHKIMKAVFWFSKIIRRWHENKRISLCSSGLVEIPIDKFEAQQQRFVLHVIRKTYIKQKEFTPSDSDQLLTPHIILESQIPSVLPNKS